MINIIDLMLMMIPHSIDWLWPLGWWALESKSWFQIMKSNRQTESDRCDEEYYYYIYSIWFDNNRWLKVLREFTSPQYIHNSIVVFSCYFLNQLSHSNGKSGEQWIQSAFRIQTHFDFLYMHRPKRYMRISAGSFTYSASARCTF